MQPSSNSAYSSSYRRPASDAPGAALPSNAPPDAPSQTTTTDPASAITTTTTAGAPASSIVPPRAAKRKLSTEVIAPGQCGVGGEPVPQHKVPRTRDSQDHLARLREDPAHFHAIPEQERTDAIYAEAARRLGRLILLTFPASALTEGVCLAAVEADGQALNHVPQERRTQAICEAAVARTPEALRFIPEQAPWAQGLCEAAVGRHPNAAFQVPQSLWTPGICKAAIVLRPTAIADIPFHLQTREMYRLALDTWGGEKLQHDFIHFEARIHGIRDLPERSFPAEAPR